MKIRGHRTRPPHTEAPSGRPPLGIPARVQRQALLRLELPGLTVSLRRSPGLIGVLDGDGLMINKTHINHRS